MTSLAILSQLVVFQGLLADLHRHELSFVQQRAGFVALRQEVSRSYNFITLKLVLIREVNGEQEDELYGQVQFEVINNNVQINEIYFAEKERTPPLEAIVKNKKMVLEVKTIAAPYLNDRVSKYLRIADAIAAQAANCTTGDNYYPGDYSKVLVDDDKIVLSQINHMNAKSLDHKDDYSLRNLEFTIPINDKPARKKWKDVEIGEMMVDFDDRSSANNRDCGDKIQRQIEQEIKTFSENQQK